MKISIHFPTQTARYSPIKGDISIAINSASLFNRFDFLCFRDKIVYDKLIATDKVSPSIGYITDFKMDTEKILIKPMFNFDSFSEIKDPLVPMVLQHNHYTSHFALGYALKLCGEGDEIVLVGLEMSPEPTTTEGEWVSKHSKYGFFKEAVWLKLLVQAAHSKKVKISATTTTPMTLFVEFVFGNIDNMEFLRRFREI